MDDVKMQEKQTEFVAVFVTIVFNIRVLLHP